MKYLSIFAAWLGSCVVASAATFIDPSSYLTGTSPSGLQWTAVATGTALPVRSSSSFNGQPGAVAYYNTRTGQLSIDPKGWSMSVFNFTYTTGTMNTSGTTPGPLRYASGTSPTSATVSGATGAQNQRTLPAGTWTLITCAPARIAGTVSLTGSPTLTQTYDAGNGAASATTPYSTDPVGTAVVGGWFTQPWSFPADLVASGSVSTMSIDNWKVFGVSGNANANVLGYGNYRGVFQYVVHGVTGNQVGAIIPYVDFLQPTVASPTSGSIGNTGVTLGGDVTADGGSSVTERGVVVSLTSANADPVISGTGVTKVVAAAAGTGVFTVDVTGLTSGSGYTYKAYAINAAGTSYSSAATFSTTGSLSSDASLSGLVLSDTTIDPGFASGTTTYAAETSFPVNSITVTPTSSHAAATIRARVNSGTYASVTSGSASGSLSLDVGSNSVEVEVTAEDGTTQRTYTVTVTRLSRLLTWKRANFSSIANSGNSADGANPSGDGLTNLEKYAFGLDPNQSTPAKLAISGNNITALGKPTVAVVTTATSVGYRARYVRRKTHADDGLTFSVEFSSDLSSWQSSAASPSVVASNADYEVVEVPYPLFLNGKKAGYFRVNVGNN